MKSIIFCDFDGTITTKETFVSVLKQFTPELSAKLIPEMYALKLTIREGVRQLLESIPSSRYPEIVASTSSNLIRPGLVELLDFLETRGVPLVVVSGGLRGMVETVLGKLVHRVHGIHAVDIDTNSEYLQVRADFEGDTELVSKVQVMKLYPADEWIAIGDSVTDFNMAMQASMVFARDRLAQYLSDRQKPYILWNNFFEIIDNLSAQWQ